MKAVVSVPACPLTTGPGPGCPLADEALYGMELEVLERAGPRWRRVRTAYGYEGWAPAGCLVSGAAAGRWAAEDRWVVRGKSAADVMREPSVRAGRLITLPLGAEVAAAERGEDWSRVELVDGRAGYVRSGTLAPRLTAPPDIPEEALRARLTETALAYRGTQYRWGGKTPQGVDCSGLVFMAYWLNGLVVYRDAELRPGFDLVEIDRALLRPGDVLFFPGHAALFLGGGRYVHATLRAGSDGVAVNSLAPGDPLYRPDLAQALTQVGSYRGFHGK